MCYDNGLVHRAWDNNTKDSMFNIAHTDKELKKTWNNAKPFVLGKQQCFCDEGWPRQPVSVCGQQNQHSWFFFSCVFSASFQQARCGPWKVGRGQRVAGTGHGARGRRQRARAAGQCEQRPVSSVGSGQVAGGSGQWAKGYKEGVGDHLGGHTNQSCGGQSM